MLHHNYYLLSEVTLNLHLHAQIFTSLVESILEAPNKSLLFVSVGSFCLFPDICYDDDDDDDDLSPRQKLELYKSFSFCCILLAAT